MTIFTYRRVLKTLFLISLLFTAPLLCGCDCEEGDATSAFGPRCNDDALMNGADGNGANGSGTGTILVSDLANSSIREFNSVSTLESTTETDPPLTGALTRLTRPNYLTIHPTTGELVVADGSGAILFFSDPTETDGNVPPTRFLTGAATELSGPTQTFIDSTNDELYVLDTANSQILVYANASTIEGDVAPIRRIGGAATAISSPNAFFFNSGTGQLSVLNPAEILTFENFRTANGSPVPTGRFGGPATTFSNLTFGVLTSGGSLIVVDSGTDQILTFESWVFDRTNEAPTRIFGGNNTRISEPRQFVLTGDTMFLADTGNVLVFEELSTLEGNDFPARFFSGIGPNTQTLQGIVFP